MMKSTLSHLFLVLSLFLPAALAQAGSQAGLTNRDWQASSGERPEDSRGKEWVFERGSKGWAARSSVIPAGLLRISADPSAAQNLVGHVRKEHLADGCSCIFNLKSDPGHAVFSDDFEGNVWMNIDGRDVKLKLISSASSPRGAVRKGQRTTSRYTAPGITVDFSSIVISLPRKEGDEITNYAATITVIKGDRRQTVNVVGGCGC